MEKILFIYDSLSKEKQEIILNPEKSINLYVCGITPYDHCHIGHARCYIVYDLLVRLIRFFNCKITYVQNITDVNEKITIKAKNLYGDSLKFLDIAKFYYKEFKILMNKLNCIAPDHSPKVSESINEIISLINQIIKSGHAYQTNDGVYFNVKSYSKYGELSDRYTKNKHNQSRIDQLHEKKNKDDFALWKNTTEYPFFESPWGKGVPGWHIECSAMIEKAFKSEQLTIHGGGIDLLFPHHENEKAQTECCLNKKITQIWMHVAFIMNNKEKMSKSLGNCFFLKDILEKHNPMVLRFYFLMHNYHCPIEFDIESINSAKNGYYNLIDILSINNLNSIQNNNINQNNNSLLNEIYDLILDNINTAALIGLIFKNKQLIKNDIYLIIEIRKIVKYILGLSLEKITNIIYEYSDEIKKLIEERIIARNNKDFKKADELRKILENLGIIINDLKL
jgi:cysteinyl-tRNA synthetase